MTPSKMITQLIEQLFEPAARAARRGDANQIRAVLAELRLIWKSKRTKATPPEVIELAQGMTFAMEGILGVVLASAGADSRYSLVTSRKYALPVLHFLGKRARAHARVHGRYEVTFQQNSPPSMKMGELAGAVGVLPQNIGDLIKAMADCELVTISDQGAERRVTITDIGIQVLDASKPGWQLSEIDHDDLDKRLEEYAEDAARQLAFISRVSAAQSQELYPATEKNSSAAHGHFVDMRIGWHEKNRNAGGYFARKSPGHDFDAHKQYSEIKTRTQNKRNRLDMTQLVIAQELARGGR
jgi:hypothetical protein